MVKRKLEPCQRNDEENRIENFRLFFFLLVLPGVEEIYKITVGAASDWVSRPLQSSPQLLNSHPHLPTFSSSPSPGVFCCIPQAKHSCC